MGKWNFTVDWTRRHNPVPGVLIVTGGALVAAAIGHFGQFSAWWAVSGTFLAILVTFAIGVSRVWTWPKLPFWVLVSATTGGWVTYTWATTPWSLPSLGVLILAAVGCGFLFRSVNDFYRRAAEQERLALLAASRNSLVDEWQARIARVCRINRVCIVAIDHWPNKTGYTLNTILPAGGSTWKSIKSYEEGLAADARLPQGCGVEVSAGADRGACLIRVSTVNALIAIRPFPTDYSPTTINEAFPIGVHRDGTSALAELRYICGVYVGQTGSGKTNVLQVTNAQLVRCIDTLVWHIDLAGGGISLPWIRPYLYGNAKQPAVDYVASNLPEATNMLDTAIRIINSRKTHYQDLMRAVDDDKLPASPEVPEIIIVADEFAELPEKLKDKLVTISNTGRAAVVRTLSCALRGTVDTIPVQLKKHARLRVGMRVTDDEELAYLFGWNGRIPSSEDAPYEGCGFIAMGSEIARPFKAFRLRPSQIEDIAVAVADRRPVLDKISAQAAGRAYATRWERATQLFAPADRFTPTQGDSRSIDPADSVDSALKKLESSTLAFTTSVNYSNSDKDHAIEDELAKFRAELDKLGEG